VVGHLLPLGAGHGHQVGQTVAPHRLGILGGGGGGGEEHRLYGLAVVGHHLARGVGHRLGDLLGVALGVVVPILFGLLGVYVGLTAPGVGADVRLLVLMGVGPHLPQGVG